MLLAMAGCQYVMGIPGSDDVMLNYQSTSYHDVAAVRELLGLRPAPEFEAWLAEMGLWADGGLTGGDGPVLDTAARAVAEAAPRELPA